MMVGGPDGSSECCPSKMSVIDPCWNFLARNCYRRLSGEGHGARHVSPRDEYDDFPLIKLQARTSQSIPRCLDIQCMSF